MDSSISKEHRFTIALELGNYFRILAKFVVGDPRSPPRVRQGDAVFVQHRKDQIDMFDRLRGRPHNHDRSTGRRVSPKG
jgi:hypothetical protein